MRITFFPSSSLIPASFVWRPLPSSIGNMLQAKTQILMTSILSSSLLRPHVFRSCLVRLSLRWFPGNSILLADIVGKKITYFELFRLQPNFEIDVSSLKQEFRKLQSQLHPDKFATGSENEKKDSLDASSHINKAYQTLINVHSRGLYMLQLAGKEIPEESSDTNLSHKFLEKMMEINEKVSESSPKQVAEMMKEIQFKLGKLEKELSKAFSVCNYDLAKELLVEYQFYNNALDRLKMKLV